MKDEKLFEEMYLIPRFLLNDLKKVIDPEKFKYLKTMNKEKNDESNIINSSFDESSGITDLNYSQSDSLSNSKTDHSLNTSDFSPIAKSSPKKEGKKRGAFKQCIICKKNLHGKKRLEEHMSEIHGEMITPTSNKKNMSENTIKKPSKKLFLDDDYIIYK